MSERWLYLLPAGLGECSGAWPVMLWQAGQAVATCCDLDSACSCLQGVAVNVVLPQEMIGWTLSPPQMRRVSSQAIVFAVEEQLDAPLESLHFAVGARGIDDRYPVLTADRQLFARIIELLTGTGIVLAAVYADADLLPETEPCALRVGERWLLGGALPARLALSSHDAMQLKPELPEMKWYCDAAESTEPLGTSPVQSTEVLLFSIRSTSVDLLQGSFRRRRAALSWQWPMCAMLLLCTLASLFDFSRAQFLQSRAEELRQSSVVRFQQLFPGHTPGPDLEAQLKALQHNRVSSESLMQRFEALSEVMVVTGNVHLERAQWQEGQEWQLLVLARGLSDLERLRAGAELVVEQATQSQEGIRANVVWTMRK